MKLLLDERISGKVAKRLRGRGHDVTAGTDDPSLRGISDPDLFEVAQQQGRALITYNRVDFEPIIREYAEANREHYGLVIVHPERFPSSEFARLVAAMSIRLRQGVRERCEIRPPLRVLRDRIRVFAHQGGSEIGCGRRDALNSTRIGTRSTPT